MSKILIDLGVKLCYSKFYPGGEMKIFKFIGLAVAVFWALSQGRLSKAAEKDIIRQWIKEDTEKEAVSRLEKLAEQREKAMAEANKAKIKQLYKEGSELINLKKYEAARDTYEKILALNPKEFKAEEYIARIDEVKRLSEARRSQIILSQEEKERRDNFQRLAREGGELYRKQEYIVAREKWEEALRYDPDNEGLKELIKRSRLQEVEKAREEVAFEKELEEKAGLSAVDKAYLPKSRKKTGPEKAEEEMISKEEEAKRKLEEMLEKTEITLDLKDVDLRKIVNEITSKANVNILVDWTAISEATGAIMSSAVPEKKPGEGEAPVEETAAPVETGEIKTMHLDLVFPNPMPLKSLLDYIMKLTRLKYRVEEHAVLISTPQALEKEEMIVKVYKLKYGMTKLRTVTLKALGKEEEK